MAGRPPVAVKVTGGAEVARALKSVGESTKDLTKANRAIAQMVANAAAGIGPNPTGTLAGGYRPRGTTRRAAVANAVPYAPPIEFGWPRRNIEAQRRIERAVEANRETIVEMHAEGLREIGERHGF